METWWFYEMPNAQAAFDSVVELILSHGHGEWTGVGVVSRAWSDDRDHLYLFVWSVDPPRPVAGIERVLNEHGRRSTISFAELVEPEGLQLYGSGDGLTTLGFMLWQFPGEIELHWPEGSPRIYWVGMEL